MNIIQIISFAFMSILIFGWAMFMRKVDTGWIGFIIFFAGFCIILFSFSKIINKDKI